VDFVEEYALAAEMSEVETLEPILGRGKASS